MKAGLLAAISVVTTVISSPAWGESIFRNIYMAADMGTIVAPGFIGANGISSTPRLAVGIRPNQGWGIELGAISVSSSCGCASPYTSTGALILPVSNELTGVDAIGLFDIYTQPVNEWIAMFGKLGVVQTDYWVDTTTGNTVHNTSTSFGGGVGLQVQLTKKFGLRLQYEEMRTANYVTGINRLRYTSAGWFLRFH